MKKKLVYIATIFLLLLVACNTNDQSLKDDSISSLNTDATSENYPQTQPIKTQNAKYEFRVIQDNYDGQAKRYFAIEQGQRPNTNGDSSVKRGIEQNNQEKTQQVPQQAPENNTQQQAQTQQQNNNETDQRNNDFVQKVVELTNAERVKQGLSPLKAYTDLNTVADAKAEDMANKGYFSHTSPTYGSPFDMMRDFGITYKSAGENLAAGQTSPEEVVNAWMNSEGHRANILSEKFTHIGVGFEQNGNQWVQMFVKK
ncbi:CAP domain-containing protein [Aquibacillus salsiterrae]|uniref:CAP domain-containing protein n=1 Tax=Aquibacillus salsiterrae TaxID=2950439 RepID=A0A9X3WF99_9BACI|nr:CAP domain-containing protein [Aquibacillus salsiterrae]MDC3418742.1 CAP domain-containing protein [Aquibacillus salsiterrae]